MNVKGSKFRSDDYWENIGLGRLGWEEGSKGRYFIWFLFIKEKFIVLGLSILREGF